MRKEGAHNLLLRMLFISLASPAIPLGCNRLGGLSALHLPIKKVGSRISRTLTAEEPFHRLKLLILNISLAMMVPITPITAAQADIAILDTMERPETREIRKGIESICQNCGDIVYRSMQGDLRQGQSILSDFRDRIKDKELDLVVTLGRPASQILARDLTNAKILYSLVSRPLASFEQSNNLSFIPSDATIKLQLAVLTQLAPSVKRVGVLGNPKSIAPLRPAIQAEARSMDLDVDILEVQSEKQLPKALNQIMQSTDAILFLRDPTIINSDSIDFIAQTTLENGIPTIGYSKNLVTRGLLFALEPNYFRLGQRIGSQIEDKSMNTIPSETYATMDDFVLHINMSSAKRIPNVKIDQGDKFEMKVW